MFEKREWVKGDQAPGASDLNRIENGIADNDSVIERIKALPKLNKSAKLTDAIDAYNALIDVVNADNQEEIENVLKEETEVEEVAGSPDEVVNQNKEGE